MMKAQSTNIAARRMLQRDTRGSQRLAPANDCEPVRLTWTRVALEDEILAVLDRQPDASEQLAHAFARKEHELASVLARLSVIDAMALQRRLSLALPDDPIAMKFGRLVADRRARLVAFLADARRREAIRGARMGGARG